VIREVLRAISDGDFTNKGDIADLAGVQESTSEIIFSMLSSKGYLKTVEGAKDMPIGCIGCPMSRDCMKEIQTRNIYVITKKGKKVLETFKSPNNKTGTQLTRTRTLDVLK
jgi:DNA-binding IscR family transcriptional regulator